MPKGSITRMRDVRSFRHHALDDIRDDIRLIRLEPAVTSGRFRKCYESFLPQPVHCTIKSFARCKRPPYQALSYAWGPAEPVRAVAIDNHKLTIRKNLYDFLLAAQRNSWIQERMWIDQLCIDQNNMTERSAQVQRMTSTYAEAQEVLIWLGNHGRLGDEIMDAIRRNPREQSDWGTKKEMDYFARNIGPNPYWSRLWIAQELHHARAVGIACSNSKFAWKEVKESNTVWANWSRGFGFKTLSNKVHNVFVLEAEARKLDGNLPTCTTVYAEPRLKITYGLIEGLFYSMRAECSDPRDKLFAIMSIVDEKQRIEVDYSKTPAGVYIDLLKKLGKIVNLDIAIFRVLSLLLHIAVQMGLLQVKDREELTKLYTFRAREPGDLRARENNCERPLRVVEQLLVHSEARVSLDFSDRYADIACANFPNVMEPSPPYYSLGRDTTREPFEFRRDDLNEAELMQRFDLFRRIVEARREWDVEDGCEYNMFCACFKQKHELDWMHAVTREVQY